MAQEITAATDIERLRRVRIEQREPLVSVVIPARNEADNLTYVLPRIPSDVYEIILVDGHSTDDTVAVAQELAPDVHVVRQQGRGKGDALRSGFAASTGDIVVMLDADGSTDPQEIPRFVNALLRGADFAKGSRYLEGGGSADITLHRSLGNICLSQLVNRLFSTQFTDLCYGYNAFWRDCLDCFEVDSDGFEVETLMNIRAHQSALVIREVPSFEYQRIHGQSNLHVVRDGVRVLRTVAAEWWGGLRHMAKVKQAGSASSRLDRWEAMPTLELPAVSPSVMALAVESTTSDSLRSAPPSPPAATVSVIVAAYTAERWPRLLQVIAALKQQTYPPEEIILVIDSNPALYATAEASLPGVRVVQNAHARGLSGARNTGIALATSEFVAFVDDDAIPEPTWLVMLLAACQAPTALGVGGALTPEWQNARPRWFPDEFGWVIGCSYTGLPTKRAKIRNMIGASMCIRRNAFDLVGGFREDMGRVGGHAVGCEETEWCLRAQHMLLGGHFLYEPGAISHHWAPASRATIAYFSARCFFEGVSKAQVVTYSDASRGLAAERAHVFHTLPRGVGRGLGDVFLRGDPTGALRAIMLLVGLLLTALGYALGRLTILGRRALDLKGARQTPPQGHASTLVDLPVSREHTDEGKQIA